MKKPIAVVALGRNAFGTTLPEQKNAVAHAVKAIADLIEDKYTVVITHSNGPQIGMLHTAMTEFSRLDPTYTVAPLAVCGALSQGYIGYDLQNALRTELLSRGLMKTVSTIITQVQVDPFDPAFTHPSKIIGRTMSRAEAEAEEHKGNYVVEEGNGFRRIIPSPKPIDIIEMDAIRVLAENDQVVIACGGGGIPVLAQGIRLQGASAIIEKDATASLLARKLKAEVLLFITNKDQLTLNQEDGTALPLESLSLEQASAYLDEGYFTAGLDRPKMQAAVDFVADGSGRRAVITSLGKAKLGLHDQAGTIIR